MKLHIGIDDTDSWNGFCTTYLGAVLKERLERYSDILELRLVRLNPNIPWKTRGNGAVALSIETSDYNRAVTETLETVEEYSAMDEEGTNPGVAFVFGKVNSKLTSFYYRALRDIVTIEETERFAQHHSWGIHKFKNGRGIIGALAAIGADLSEHTYELIAYRRRENWGRVRKVDPVSVFKMDRATCSGTFNNVDRETSRVLVTPRSPCPILFGVRSYTKEILDKAKNMVDPGEPVERHAIFKTNQGTDSHLIVNKISEVKPFTSVIVKGTVVNEPTILKGGHVIFAISENTSKIDCAAFEPTGGFREYVKRLKKGDVIKAYGGVNETLHKTVNLEKFEPIRLIEHFEVKNPVCVRCQKRMESSGQNQGFRCRKCRTSSDKKEFNPVKRELEQKVYCVPPRAMRHLSKPVNEEGE
jgi:tRNA(Ile2)-agmatinylcytidine synthase